MSDTFCDEQTRLSTRNGTTIMLTGLQIMINLIAVLTFLPTFYGWLYFSLAVCVQFVLILQDGCEIFLRDSRAIAHFITTVTIAAPFILVLMMLIGAFMLEDSLEAALTIHISTGIIMFLRTLRAIDVGKSFAWKLLYGTPS